MRQYFKGYYFKCSTKNETIAFIPAFHSDGKENTASLQVITNDNAYVVSYSKIRFDNQDFRIQIGHNYFSKKGIYLDVESDGCSIHGKLKFNRFQKIKYNIMGPFQYIPYMQCKHDVISMHHLVTGKISINNKEYIFNCDKGYIEGDRGYSFPKEYIWTQCHYLGNSLMLSVADIPLIGVHFKGIIGIVMIADKEYRIATYLGAKVISAKDNMIVVKQGRYRLSAKLIETKSQQLNAPVNGKMSRTIHESASCKAWYQFTYNNDILLEFTSDNASFEYEF